MAGKKKRLKIEAEEDYFAFLEEGAETSTVAELKTSWPGEIPVLTGDDLAWNYSLSGGRRDLLEWLGVVFLDAKKHAKAERILLAVINEWSEDKSWSCLWYFLEYAWKKRKPSTLWQAAAHWRGHPRRLWRSPSVREPKRLTR
jgi:hypothetical protein